MSDVDGLRREIVEALTAPDGGPWWSPQTAADLVLRVVTAWAERQAREKAAEELQAAAEALAAVPGNPYPLVIREYLNDRAAALADDGRA